MGLDCYAFTKTKPKAKPVELWYARKNRWVHNWFEKIYREQFPEDNEDFNCKKVEITEELLDQLQADLDSGELRKSYGAGGFFFGEWVMDADDEKSVSDLITAGRAALSQGLIVYYDSWW